MMRFPTVRPRINMTSADPPGRIAFISGGASGIGLAVAALLQRRGMKLMLMDHDRAWPIEMPGSCP